MNGGGGIGRVDGKTYVAMRDPNTDEASFLMCLLADSNNATWVYLQYRDTVMAGPNFDQERIRYRVLFTNDSVDSKVAPIVMASLSFEDAKKYGRYTSNGPGDVLIDLRGSIITKAEYDSYLEMKVLPHVRVGTSLPKYPR